MAYIKKIKLPRVETPYEILDANAVPNTRKVNGKQLNEDISLTADDVGALPTTGGTLTGDLKVGSATIRKNGYVVGTWLQGTSANHQTTAATKIAVQDGSGRIYHRTAEEVKSDIGLGNVDNVKQYSASNPPPYPVTSVNGQTGAVTIDAGGSSIPVQAATPTGQKVGDLWFKVV